MVVVQDLEQLTIDPDAGTVSLRGKATRLVLHRYRRLYVHQLVWWRVTGYLPRHGELHRLDAKLPPSYANLVLTRKGEGREGDLQHRRVYDKVRKGNQAMARQAALESLKTNMPLPEISEEDLTALCVDLYTQCTHMTLNELRGVHSRLEQQVCYPEELETIDELIKRKT